MSNDWETWLYVAACLGVPAAWGAVAAWLFGKLDRRRKAKPGTHTDDPYVDYHI